MGKMARTSRRMGRGGFQAVWRALREESGEHSCLFAYTSLTLQIRTLLIDCLVMTNLFYPSLAVYLQKRFPRSAGVDSNQAGPSRHRSFRNEHPLTLFSTPLLDSVFPEIPPLIPRLGDRAWWEDEDERWEIGLQRDMPWLEEELRIMRVAWASVSDILDGSDDGWDERDWTVLRYLRDMADEWELGQCIRTEEGGECGMLDLHTGSTLDETPQTTNDVYRGVAIPFTIPRNASASFDMRWAQTMDELSRRHNAELFRQPRDTRQGDWTGTWSLSVSHSPGNIPNVSLTMLLHNRSNPLQAQGYPRSSMLSTSRSSLCLGTSFRMPVRYTRNSGWHLRVSSSYAARQSCHSAY